MTDMTAFVHANSLAGVTPVYTQATAADFFTAAPGSKYMLHYKNAATPTGILKVSDPSTPVPDGSTAVAGFADLQVSAALGATTEKVITIPNSSRFRDANGRINMVNVTPTTLTVAIFGPL
jgi:hypothetical protein